MSLGGVEKIGIEPDRTGLDHESDHRSDHRKKKSFKEKKNQIVYQLVIVIKNKSGKLKYLK